MRRGDGLQSLLLMSILVFMMTFLAKSPVPSGDDKTPIGAVATTVNAAPKGSGRVHVVLAGDRLQSLGVVACARSVFANTARPERVSLHVITDRSSAADIGEALACSLPRNHSVRVYPFELENYTKYPNGTSRIRIRVPVKKHKTNLASDLNFARFYLSEFLEADEEIEKIIYLDADTIVFGDVAKLYDETLTSRGGGHAFAAVSRKFKKICGAFLNCGVPEVDKLLVQQNISDPEDQLDAFNAGIMMIDLRRWKEERYTERIEYWIRWNEKLPLYDLASNPPLVLAARGQFEHLDEAWNCQKIHACWWAGNASAMHWNGVNKPWALKSEHDREYWLVYLLGNDEEQSKKCIDKLPDLGTFLVTNETKKDYSPEVKEDAVATWKSSSYNDTWRDFDLVKQAERLIVDYGDDDKEAGGGGIELPSTFASRVRLEATRSLDRVDSFDDLESLIRAIRAYLGLIEPPNRCDFVLVAITNHKVAVDVTHFGRDEPCGLVPPENLVSFLYFLSMLNVDRGLEINNVAFVVGTGMSTAKTTNRAPVFVFAKRRGREQPGVLVPGPAYISQDLDKRSDHEPMSARNLGTALPDEENKLEFFDAFVRSGLEVWNKRFDALRNSTDRGVWSEREPKATWRGRFNVRYFSCIDDAAWARLEVLGLTQDHPNFVEAHLTSAKEEPDDIEFCVKRAVLKPELARRLTKMLRKGLLVSRPSAGALKEYAKTKFAVLLPEPKHRPDSHSSSLWGIGSAILIWDSPLVSRMPRWISPALQNGVTHVSVTANTLTSIVGLLRSRDSVAVNLAANARILHEHVLCPDCIRLFWRDALKEYGERFPFDQSETGHQNLEMMLQYHGFVLTPIEDIQSWFVGRFMQK